jgi:hypothetical protein
MRKTRELKASTLALAASLGLGPLAAQASAGGMDSYAWSNRPVIVFAASADDQRAKQQLALLSAAQTQTDDRDIVVLAVWPDRVEGSGSLTLDPEALRARYQVPTGSFAVLLIGKDTGVKRRADTVIDLGDLFSQIDGMPMRLREMQQSN